jgi:hypothetical protein
MLTLLFGCTNVKKVASKIPSTVQGGQYLDHSTPVLLRAL